MHGPARRERTGPPSYRAGPVRAGSCLRRRTIHLESKYLWKFRPQERDFVQRPASEWFQELIEAIPVITFAGRSYALDDVEYISPQVETFLGVTQDEWLSNPQIWFTLLHPDDSGRVLHEIARATDHRAPLVSEYRLLTPTGEEVWVEHSALRRAGADGVESVVGTLTVVTARKQAEEKLRNLAFVDELTRLLNRRGFFHLAERQLRLSARSGRGAVLIYIDVNGMKAVNDRLGHDAGDRLLMEVAELLRSTFRGTDILARLGGDEFVALAVETDTDRRELLGSRLQERLDVLNAVPGREYQISMSTGEAYFDPDQPVGLRDLMLRADEGMYRHKFRR
jgi:diguanylate cyclase (GGDEF)-like protein/PAS domain S-box-containing protein